MDVPIDWSAAATKSAREPAIHKGKAPAKDTHLSLALQPCVRQNRAHLFRARRQFEAVVDGQ
jgi:hypothetical protein